MFYIDPIYVLMGLVTVMIVFIAIMGLIMFRMTNLLGGIINEIHKTAQKALRHADRAGRVAKEAHVIASVVSGNGTAAGANAGNHTTGDAAVFSSGENDADSGHAQADSAHSSGHSQGIV
jgi:hypothetical protein